MASSGQEGSDVVTGVDGVPSTPVATGVDGVPATLTPTDTTTATMKVVPTGTMKVAPTGTRTTTGTTMVNTMGERTVAPPALGATMTSVAPTPTGTDTTTVVPPPTDTTTVAPTAGGTTVAGMDGVAPTNTTKVVPTGATTTTTMVHPTMTTMVHPTATTMVHPTPTDMSGDESLSGHERLLHDLTGTDLYKFRVMKKGDEPTDTGLFIIQLAGKAFFYGSGSKDEKRTKALQAVTTYLVSKKLITPTSSAAVRDEVLQKECKMIWKTLGRKLFDGVYMYDNKTDRIMFWSLTAEKDEAIRSITGNELKKKLVTWKKTSDAYAMLPLSHEEARNKIISCLKDPTNNIIPLGKSNLKNHHCNTMRQKMNEQDIGFRVHQGSTILALAEKCDKFKQIDADYQNSEQPPPNQYPHSQGPVVDTPRFATGTATATPEYSPIHSNFGMATPGSLPMIHDPNLDPMVIAAKRDGTIQRAKANATTLAEEATLVEMRKIEEEERKEEQDLIDEMKVEKAEVKANNRQRELDVRTTVDRLAALQKETIETVTSKETTQIESYNSTMQLVLSDRQARRERRLAQLERIQKARRDQAAQEAEAAANEQYALEMSASKATIGAQQAQWKREQHLNLLGVTEPGSGGGMPQRTHLTSLFDSASTNTPQNKATQKENIPVTTPAATKVSTSKDPYTLGPDGDGMEQLRSPNKPAPPVEPLFGGTPQGPSLRKVSFSVESFATGPDKPLQPSVKAAAAPVEPLIGDGPSSATVSFSAESFTRGPDKMDPLQNSSKPAAAPVDTHNAPPSPKVSFSDESVANGPDKMEPLIQPAEPLQGSIKPAPTTEPLIEGTPKSEKMEPLKSSTATAPKSEKMEPLQSSTAAAATVQPQIEGIPKGPSSTESVTPKSPKMDPPSAQVPVESVTPKSPKMDPLQSGAKPTEVPAELVTPKSQKMDPPQSDTKLSATVEPMIKGTPKGSHKHLPEKPTEEAKEDPVQAFVPPTIAANPDVVATPTEKQGHARVVDPKMTPISERSEESDMDEFLTPDSSAGAEDSTNKGGLMASAKKQISKFFFGPPAVKDTSIDTDNGGGKAVTPEDGIDIQENSGEVKVDNGGGKPSATEMDMLDTSDTSGGIENGGDETSTGGAKVGATKTGSTLTVTSVLQGNGAATEVDEVGPDDDKKEKADGVSGQMNHGSVVTSAATAEKPQSDEKDDTTTTEKNEIVGNHVNDEGSMTGEQNVAADDAPTEVEELEEEVNVADNDAANEPENDNASNEEENDEEVDVVDDAANEAENEHAHEEEENFSDEEVEESASEEEEEVDENPGLEQVLVLRGGHNWLPAELVSSTDNGWYNLKLALVDENGRPRMDDNGNVLFSNEPTNIRGRLGENIHRPQL